MDRCSPIATRTGLVLIVLLAVCLVWFGTVAEARDSKPPLEGPFDGNFILFDPPVPAPRQGFTDLAGAPASLDGFKGQVLLVNFWATWCAPCIREMPELDELHAELNSEGLTVLALSTDRAGARVVAPFVEDLGLPHLPIFLDPKGEVAEAFNVHSLPATFLIDREGRVVGGMTGIAPWSGPEAQKLVRHYLEAAPPQGAIKTGG